MADIIPKEVKKETIDSWLAEQWKACLLTNAFTYVSGTHVSYTDLTNEVVGAGYTVGGKDLVKLPWGGGSGYTAEDGYLKADNIAWSNATLSNVRYIAVYENTTASKKIRAIYQFPSDKTVPNGTMTVLWNALGLIRIF